MKSTPGPTRDSAINSVPDFFRQSPHLGSNLALGSTHSRQAIIFSHRNFALILEAVIKKSLPGEVKWFANFTRKTDRANEA
jgi:hypothetical protein